MQDCSSSVIGTEQQRTLLRDAARVNGGRCDVESVAYLFAISTADARSFLEDYRDIDWEPVNLECSVWRVYEHSRRP